MGLVVDVVPNHMGIMGADNAWWLDVLEHGPAARHAGFFDIDWRPLDETMAGRVLVPVLADHYGLVLERGELKLAFDPAAGEFSVWYHGHRFPVDPREYPRDPGARRAPAARRRVRGAAAPAAIRRRRRSPCAIATRSSQKRRLAQAGRRGSGGRRGDRERASALINGQPGAPESFERLHELLEAQAYRLAFWRVASDEINYRRFFDINDLAALRMEDEAVFDATHRSRPRARRGGQDRRAAHRSPGRALRSGRLFRPAAARLRAGGVASTAARRRRPAAAAAVGGRGEDPRRPRAPRRVLGRLRHHRLPLRHGRERPPRRHAREAADRADLAQFTGRADRRRPGRLLGKRAIMRAALASELTVLATELLRIARADRRTRDYTFNSLRQALAEVVACFPVYRTYSARPVSRQDRRYIEWAVARARRRSRAADARSSISSRTALLAEAADGAPAALAPVPRVRDEVPAVHRAGDRQGGRGHRLLCYTPARRRSTRWAAIRECSASGRRRSTARAPTARRTGPTRCSPPPPTTTSAPRTCARASTCCRRCPRHGGSLLRRWSRMNRSKKREVDGAAAPARHDEYLLYQTLLGTFPCGRTSTRPRSPSIASASSATCSRPCARRSCTRAGSTPTRSTKRRSRAFVRGAAAEGPGNLFLDELRAQAARIAWFGALNSLA